MCGKTQRDTYKKVKKACAGNETNPLNFSQPVDGLRRRRIFFDVLP